MSRPDQPISVLLVDDHPLVLDGITALLEAVPTLKVVGQANSGEQALRLAAELQPEVVLMDVSMPGMNGLEAAGLFQQRFPAIKVLILSMHDNREYILKVMQSGARGYLLKDVSSEELVNAIETVAIGNTYICQSASRSLFVNVNMAPPSEPVQALTKREQMVLKLLAEGHSNKRIAQQLDISVRTVETHRQNIKAKLEIHTAAGLARYAIEQGLVDKP